MIFPDADSAVCFFGLGFCSESFLDADSDAIFLDADSAVVFLDADSAVIVFGCRFCCEFFAGV